jgi:hypothetical protein
MENMEEMHQFWDVFDLPKLNHLSGSIVARKGRPEKKQKGWCSDNDTGGQDGKAER